MRRSPFHSRTAQLNETMLWEHWAGYVAATKYQHSVATEYYAVRNAVGVFDTSPLFKYDITGPEATDLLTRVLARDVRRCPVGRAQYTVWCDDNGFVMEDGVVLRLDKDHYRLTTARPNLKHFADHSGDLAVVIDDVSQRFGLLALQGPQAHTVLAALGGDVDELAYFDVTSTALADIDVVVSRTGYTGDLGYEVWVEAADAEALWDAVFAAGAGRGVMPIGTEALNLARIDAGLLLIDVDFASSRFAWVDAQRETPAELALDWMVGPLDDDDRDFVGRSAIEEEARTAATRWRTVGLMVDVPAYEALFNDRGLVAPKDGVMVLSTLSLYSSDYAFDPDSEYLGYATSFAYSPILKRHVAIAKVPPQMAIDGTEIYVELSVVHKPHCVLARVTALPFYDPPRKTALPVMAEGVGST